METMQKVLPVAAVVVGTTAFVRLSMDVLHVSKVMRDRAHMYEPLTLSELKSIQEKYSNKVKVSKQEFYDSIDSVSALVKNDEAGIVELTSQTYRMINRESVVMLGGPAAVLLQTAHPYVAYGVDQHSAVKVSPHLRFQKTFRYLFAIIYGRLRQSTNTAKFVRSLHDRVKGTIEHDFGNYKKGDQYDASDLGALIWVFTTLVDIGINTYEMILRRLSEEEKNQYIEDARRGALFFGIPKESFPKDWHDFEHYNRFVWHSGTLSVSPPAQYIQNALLRGVAVLPPARWMAALQIPPHLRKEFGFQMTIIKCWVAILYFSIIRFVYRLMPVSLRSFPTFVRAMRRIEGKDGLPWLTKLGEFLGTLFVRIALPGSSENEEDDTSGADSETRTKIHIP